VCASLSVALVSLGASLLPPLDLTMLKTLRLLLQPHPQAVSRLAARSVATRLFSSSAAPNVLVIAEHNNTVRCARGDAVAAMSGQSF